MTTQTPHSNGSTRQLRLVFVLLVTLLVAGTFTVSPSRAGSSAYNWPVKPFGKEHPVRGNFGDPRTLFAAPPTTAGALSGAGSFQFHFGVDISAPNGTAVYPVVSGTVSRISTTDGVVAISCSDGRAFEYWHIRPAVRVGERVTAFQTVLGRITRPSNHVHLAELQGGRWVNPLQSGHLTPFTDTVAPRIRSLSIRKSASTVELPNLVRGSVDLIVEAYDTPNLPVAGNWRDMPVSPARITWRIQDMTGRRVAATSIATDFRTGIPSSSAFWSYYARGSYQNMSVFAKHYSFMQPGRYLFRLTRSPFDTTRLHDGIYELVVTASDVRGNSTTDSLRFTVHNGPVDLAWK